MSAGDIETVHQNGRWLTRVEGEGGTLGSFDTKEQAFEHGRQKAFERGVKHITKNHDGFIGERNIYPGFVDSRGIPINPV